MDPHCTLLLNLRLPCFGLGLVHTAGRVRELPNPACCVDQAKPEARKAKIEEEATAERPSRMVRNGGWLEARLHAAAKPCHATVPHAPPPQPPFPSHRPPAHHIPSPPPTPQPLPNRPSRSGGESLSEQLRLAAAARQLHGLVFQPCHTWLKAIRLTRSGPACTVTGPAGSPNHHQQQQQQQQPNSQYAGAMAAAAGVKWMDGWLVGVTRSDSERVTVLRQQRYGRASWLVIAG